MSRRTHLWLLHRGAPAAQPAVHDWLRRLLQDRRWAGRSMPWYLPWLGGLLAGLWGRRLLAAPEGEPGPADQAAKKLSQILGDGWLTRSVAVFGGPDAASASAGVADGDRALLLPLLPQRSAARDAQITAAREALASRRVEIAVLDPLAERPGFVEASAESVRAALVDLPPGARYAVLFYAPALADGHESRLRDEIERDRQGVVAALGLRRPHELGWIRGPGAWGSQVPTLRRAARDLCSAGPTHVVLMPLGQTLAWLEVDRELHDLIAAFPAVKWSMAEPVALRPTLLRDIAEHATNARDRLQPPPREELR